MVEHALRRSGSNTGNKVQKSKPGDAVARIIAVTRELPLDVDGVRLAQLLADPDAGIEFARVVHGDQRFTFTRPIVAGDELIATLTVTSVKSLGGHSMVTAESSIVDADGQHVVTAISTLVVRGEE